MQSDFARQLCTELHTPRLVLQPRRGSHAEAAFEPLQNAALYQWMSARKPESAQWLTERWARLESRLSPDGAEAWLAWTVFLRSTGAHIGQVDAVVNDDRVCTNFGYYLFPPFWGQGLATEAAQSCASHLLQQGMGQLFATVTVGNHASVRVLDNAGFLFNRILPDNDCLRGVSVDDVQYIRTA